MSKSFWPDNMQTKERQRGFIVLVVLIVVVFIISTQHKPSAYDKCIELQRQTPTAGFDCGPEPGPWWSTW